MSNRRSFLDDIDLQILDELKKNARIHLRSLAAKLEISTSTLHYRINRLEEEDILLGYHAEVDLKPEDSYFQIALFISVYPKEFLNFKQYISQFSQIIAIYELLGNYNFLLIIKSKDQDEFIDKIYNPVSKLEFIRKIQTNVIVSVHKEIKRN